PRRRRHPFRLQARPRWLLGRVLRRPHQDLRRGQLPAGEVGDVRLSLREPLGSGYPRPRVLRRRRETAGREGRRQEVKPWSLVSFRTAAGGERAGVLFDGRLVDLPISPRSLLDLIDDWPAADGILRNFHPVDADEVLDAELLLPFRYPRKVLCSGANYAPPLRRRRSHRP